MAVDMF